jgi:glycosyltransferase involved in cell wall biosynthesis
MMPTVSTIIPTRNRAGFLGAALGSVAAQEIPDMEVIVVDDGSDRPELTQAAIEPFEDRLHTRYILLEARGRMVQPSGASRARNEGLKAATGEYIAFLDDDDVWHPGKIRKQLERFQSNPRRLSNLGVVYVWHQWANAATKRVRVQRRPRLETIDDLFRWSYNIIPTALMRRACLDAVGGFDEEMPKENLDLHARIMSRFQFDLVEEILVTCHDHAGPRASDDVVARGRGIELLLERYESRVADPRVLHGFRYRLGRLLLAVGDHSRARQELGRALRLAPAGLKPRYFASWAAAMLVRPRPVDRHRAA